jgi:hypothetical protein
MERMKQSLLLLAAILVLTLAACDAQGPNGPTSVRATVIRSNTSFGFCLGYCRSTLEITAEHATYRLIDDRRRQPTLERTVPISASEWHALESAVDRRRLEALATVIGCPDCADQGAESLEVVGEDWSRTITFEYRAALPPLQPLLDRVRDIRDRIDSELRPRD